jgi:hypothetical protein
MQGFKIKFKGEMKMDKESLDSAIKEIRELRKFDEEQNSRKLNNDLHEKLRILEANEPIVHHFKMLNKRDELTFEQALIGMVLALSEQKHHLQDEILKIHQNSTRHVFRP